MDKTELIKLLNEIEETAKHESKWGENKQYYKGVLDFASYTAEEFERLCDYARYIYLKSGSLPPEAIAKAIIELLKQGKTVGEITAMDKHVFIDKACWYL